MKKSHLKMKKIWSIYINYTISIMRFLTKV